MSTQYQTQQVPGNPCRKPTSIAPRLTAVQVAQTLGELVQMGFIEPVKDGFGITRYRPVSRGAKKLESHGGDFIA